VARRAPSDDVPPTVAQMAQPLPMPERTVLYLTDLPRLDELPSYAALGIEVVVVPYPVLPRLLRAAARAAGLRLVDWSRRNAWHRPRPQWVPRAISATIHYYQRDHCGIGPPADDQPVRLVRRTLADTGTPTWHVVPGVTTPAAGWPGCHDADDESALETVVAGWTVAEGASR
jgi:hypothetical protein